jgi:hypothetical protein
LRPIEETIRDTVSWARVAGSEPPRQADGRYRVQTLARDRELLARLR